MNLNIPIAGGRLKEKHVAEIHHDGVGEGLTLTSVGIRVSEAPVREFEI